MYSIAKKFSFSASHELKGLPQGHPCGRLHGHNYEITVEIASNQLDEFGFVIDYRDLSKFKELLDNRFDHKHLNDVLAGYRLAKGRNVKALRGVFVPSNPTAENLARMLYDLCKVLYPQTVAVRVSETPKTWAEYRP